jgi:hypothetical protein
MALHLLPESRRPGECDHHAAELCEEAGEHLLPDGYTFADNPDAGNMGNPLLVITVPDPSGRFVEVGSIGRIDDGPRITYSAWPTDGRESHVKTLETAIAYIVRTYEVH